METKAPAKETPTSAIRVLLLDDRADDLMLRSAILRRHGYDAIAAQTIEAATASIQDCDIAVLDYHLGAGKFGTEVADKLRQARPHVPIIILSAVLEQRFGGVEDMHLLKGHSSVQELLAALRSFEAKKRGKPVVVDARDFYYSRIARAMGDDVILEVLDGQGNFIYVNDNFAQLLQKKREWFTGRNLFEELPEQESEWREILKNVVETRETYIDRKLRGLPYLAADANALEELDRWVWNLIAFPITLHNREAGVVVSARKLERK